MYTDTLLHTNAHTCSAKTCHTQRCTHRHSNTRSGTQIIIHTGAHTKRCSHWLTSWGHTHVHKHKHMPTETHTHTEMLTPVYAVSRVHNHTHPTLPLFLTHRTSAVFVYPSVPFASVYPDVHYTGVLDCVLVSFTHFNCHLFEGTDCFCPNLMPSTVYESVYVDNRAVEF